MRFRKLEVQNFGPLKGRAFELESDVFVVYGPNEAGKSSFHGALQTILYGFERANRDEHPVANYLPGSGDLELSAEVQLDTGTLLRVERTLQSAGKLVLSDAEGNVLENSRRNEALPQLQSIPRSLFAAVYSLTANDTRMQTDEVREHIQELLLGETGLRGARPLAEVKRRLQDDIQSLWRNDQRSTPLARKLSKDINDLKAELRKAMEHDREMLKAREEREDLLPKIAAATDEIRRLRSEIEGREYAGEWRAWHVQAARQAEIEARMQSVPAEVRRAGVFDPQELESQAAKFRQDMAPLAATLEQNVPEPSPLDLHWTEHQGRVTRVLERIAARQELLRDLREAERDRSRAEQELRSALAGLGLEPRQPRCSAPARALPARLRTVGPRSRGVQSRLAGTPGRAAGLVFAALASRAWWPSPGYRAALSLLATGLVLIAIALWNALHPGQRRMQEDPPGAPDAVRTTLGELGWQNRELRSPNALQSTLQELSTAHARVGEARTAIDAAAELEQDREGFDRSISADLAALRIDDDVEIGLERLRKEWPLAAERVRRHAEATRERARAQSQLDAWQQRAAEVDQRLSATRTILQIAFPQAGNLRDAFALWKQAESDRAQLERDQARLRSHARYRSDWERAEAGESNEPIDEAELRERLEAAERERETLLVTQGRLDQTLAGDDGSRVARLSEQLLDLENQRQETLENRDRLALLARILERAESRYRQAHQPDVLRRAGEYLARITDGEYTALTYPPEDPEATDAPGLLVQTREHGWKPVGLPLSRGTQEQIYLSLRLGTLDYLDQGRESLPLILDEALVHWDESRRRSLYGVLRELAKKRQVILFTCHPSFAEEVERDMGARVISLV
ncbi:MAG: AAA family ATPase [Planctomycetota bacterium]